MGFASLGEFGGIWWAFVKDISSMGKWQALDTKAITKIVKHLIYASNFTLLPN